MARSTSVSAWGSFTSGFLATTNLAFGCKVKGLLSFGCTFNDMDLFQLQLGCYKTWQKILDMLFCSARKSPLSVSLFPVKIEGVQNIFCCLFFGLRFSIFVWLSFLVTSALYLQQFRTRIRHFAWYLFATFWHGYFAFCMVIWPCPPSILHGICYILVLQTFMWVSWKFL